MKKTIQLLAALTLLNSASALADVTLNIPDNVELLVANQARPHISGGFFSSERHIILPDGENQIVFRYNPYFTQGSDRNVVEGDAILATFSADNQTVNFDLPKYKSEQDAQKRIHGMEWQLVTEENQSIEVKQAVLVKEGLQIGRDYVREADDYNRTGGVAALTTAMLTSANQTTQQGSQHINKTTNAVDATTAEEMLHFWYNKADAKTKARFKDFVNQ
ncbi:DUF2057 domain-containing protein [Vibrio sinensis]|uniref:UPF0319 protein DZ860_14840 n=1 Tax=Vibrio sinensis TaxID=2302434 RepID=A0A3A6QDA8_9VIBR|nr:DUF2057 family protein [Vibrio sinensis]RJX69752.1 DUF2057 domain-containing protein [Vibrio sinensis]